MKEIKVTADIANATAIDLGPLAEIKDYVLELGPDVKIPGKVFGGAAVKAGGADFSGRRRRFLRKFDIRMTFPLQKNVTLYAALRHGALKRKNAKGTNK